MTAVATSVYTAAIWNTYIRDNLNASGVGLAIAGVGRHLAATGANTVAERTSNVATFLSPLQTTANTSYTDLTTAGPAVTVTSGPKALVSIGCFMSNSSAGLGSRMAVAVSGATTSAASDINSFYSESGLANDGFKGSWTTLFDPINAGSNTFTAKYRAVGGGTSSFTDRHVAVIPF